MTKEREAVTLIREAAEVADHPVAMLSFGKDSMVLADLIRTALEPGLNGKHFPRIHGFPLPVVYYRDPWFPFKHEFADQVIRSWAMEVHDPPPMHAGVKTNPERLELVARYSFGTGVIDVPKNTLAPIERREFVCGLNDWLLRPKAAIAPYPWDLVFIGHKSSDVDPFEGPVPLKDDVVLTGNLQAVFPLRNWTDSDVWDYIEQRNIPYDRRRYQDREELADKWLNPDYLHACTACIDPRNKARTVHCPKLGTLVRNMGATVLRLQELPDYIQKEEEEDAIHS